MEIANAILVRKNGDIYLHVTTYSNKELINYPNLSIGIDFGCETQLTLSDGTKIEFQISVSDKIKKLDRKIMRNQHATEKKRPDSKKKRQDQRKRKKAYEHLNNQKKDIRNKIVSALTKNFKYICFQDESIHAWHSGNHGKKIQSTGIGAILQDLKNKACVPVEVEKWFPSTQLCPQCGKKNKLELNDRIYECECGFKEDRDVKSASCIEKEGLTKVKSCGIVPMDHRDFKAGEILSTAYFDILSKIDMLKVSKMGLMN